MPYEAIEMQQIDRAAHAPSIRENVTEFLDSDSLESIDYGPALQMRVIKQLEEGFISKTCRQVRPKISEETSK